MSTPVRLYHNQALRFLENLKNNPELRVRSPWNNCVLNYMLKDPWTELSDGTALAIKQKAAEIQMPVIPGFRAFDLTPNTYDDPTQWARNTEALQGIIDLFGAPEIAVDIEYYPTVQHPYYPNPPSNMTAAVSAFMAKVHNLGVVLCLQRASVKDYVTIPLLDAAYIGSYHEGWFETDFGFSEAARKNWAGAAVFEAAGMARIKADFERRFPNARGRFFTYEDYLRNWGTAVRETELRFHYGELDPCVFLRDRFDEDKLGTPEYETGLSHHSTNDAKVWCLTEALPFDVRIQKHPMNIPVFASWPMAPSIVSPRPLRPDGPGDQINGQALRASDAFPKTGDFSLLVKFDQSAVYIGVNGPVVGCSQMNNQSWQISFSGLNDVLKFEFRPAGGAAKWAEKTIAPRTGVSQLLLVKRGSQWCIYKNGGLEVLVDDPKLLNGAGHLYLGGGIQFKADGTPYETRLDSVCYERVELWTRALSLDECTAVWSKPFPR